MFWNGIPLIKLYVHTHTHAHICMRTRMTVFVTRYTVDFNNEEATPYSCFPSNLYINIHTCNSMTVWEGPFTDYVSCCHLLSSAYAEDSQLDSQLDNQNACNQ